MICFIRLKPIQSARLTFLWLLLFLQFGCQDIVIFRKTSITAENVVVREEAGRTTIEAKIDPPLSKETVFHIRTEEDTATGVRTHIDLSVANKEIILPAGASILQIEVDIYDDTIDEDSEQFKIIIEPKATQEAGDGNDTSLINEEFIITILDDDIAITLSNAIVQEGRSYAYIRYSLSSESEEEIRFQWSTENGSASSVNGDYNSISDRLEIISSGVTGGTLRIPLKDDQVYETEEFFMVNIQLLVGVKNHSRNDLEGKVTIIDNEQPPVVTVENSSTQEKAENAEAIIQFALSAPIGFDARFQWSTMDGTAFSGEDYIAKDHQEVEISAGNLSGSMVVKIKNNDYYELDEHFLVEIIADSLVGIRADGSVLQARVDISDDDLAPMITVPSVQVSEGEGQVIVNYSLSSSSFVESSFVWSTRDGSATSTANDYTANSGIREIIPPGTDQGSFAIPIGDNSKFEAEEYFLIRISDLSHIKGNGSDLEVKINIADNDDPPTISVRDVSTLEQGRVTIHYALSVLSEQDASFRWSTFDGTAIGSEDDYTPATNQLETITAGNLEGSLKVIIGDDQYHELNEYFLVNILGDSLSNIKKEGSVLQARVEIIDSDLPPTLELESVQLREGDDANALVNYSLSSPVQIESRFTWSAQDGSATSASGDYTSVGSEQVIISKGSSSGTLIVPIVDDLKHESEEFFWIRASSVYGIKQGGSVLEAKVTISDNDQAPFVAIEDISVSEDNKAIIDVTLSAVSELDASFNWSTSDGTAIDAKGDYVSVSGQKKVIPAGNLSGTIEIEINDDLFYERDEYFLVNIDSSSLEQISQLGSVLQARVDITDNDSPPVVVIDNLEVDESIGKASLSYSLSPKSEREASFRWSTSDGSASSGSGDYVQVSNQLVTIPAESLGGKIEIDINDDNYYEQGEYFTVEIINTTLVEIKEEGSVLQARVEIIDSDLPPTLELESVQLREGDDANALVNYSLSSPVQIESRFTWSAQDGSATSASGDYTSVGSEQVIISKGSSSGTLIVPIVDDLKHESEEFFWIRASSVYGIKQGGSVLEAKVTISDNDQAPFVAIEDISVSEDNKAIIDVTLSAVSELDASFNWSTSDGTAIDAKGDYVSVSGQKKVIPAGNLSGTIEIEINDDLFYERDEYFLVNIDSSSLEQISQLGSVLQARVDITDNDSPPVVVIDNLEVDESIGKASLSYSLSPKSEREASFRWSTSDGSASSGSGDYVQVSNQLVTIPAESLGGKIEIDINDDNYYEQGEYFTVEIINTTLVEIKEEGSVLQARVDISDDDQPPSLTIESAQVKEGDQYVNINYSLSAPVQEDSQFTWSTRDDSAVSTGTNRDFTAIIAAVEVISQGGNSGVLRISLWDNTIHESDEHFWIEVSSLQGIDRDSSILRAKVNISDNDDPPIISLRGISINEGARAVISYELSSVSEQVASFRWSTADGTALAQDQDYRGITDQLVSIPAGVSSGSIEVIVNNDEYYEDNEFFTVTIVETSLVGLSQVGSVLQAQVDIVNDDQPPTITIKDIQVIEGSSKSILKYTLSSMSGKDASFRWSTSDGTAASTHNQDFTLVADQLIEIPAGTATEGNLEVVINNDGTFEPSEYFTVEISSASLTGINTDGSVLQARVEIVDDDAIATIAIENTQVREGSGQARISYSLSNPLGVESSFTWSTVDGTAISGVDGDFTAVSSQKVVIPAGVTEGALAVTIIDDDDYESEEEFIVAIDELSLLNIESGALQSSVTIKVSDHEISETFSQLSAGGISPVDFLWVIDDSASMHDNQSKLGAHFSVFINNFVNDYNQTLPIDFKMSIITTTSSEPVATDVPLDSQSLLDDKDAFIAEFNQGVYFQITGSHNEQGLQKSIDFLNNYPTWVRDNAYLVIIFLSDEDDNSSFNLDGVLPSHRDAETTDSWLNQIWDVHKEVKGMLKVYSLVSTSVLREGKRYILASNQTGGFSDDINEDYSEVLRNISRDIASLTESFPLSRSAKMSSIEVRVNGEVLEDKFWNYSEESRAIKFVNDYIPPLGASIVIAYELQ